MGVLQARLCLGLIQDMVQLLQSGGIKTVVSLVSADLEEVAQKCGLSYRSLSPWGGCCQLSSPLSPSAVLICTRDWRPPLPSCPLALEAWTNCLTLISLMEKWLEAQEARLAVKPRYVFGWLQTWATACNRMSYTSIPMAAPQPPTSSSYSGWNPRSGRAGRNSPEGPGGVLHWIASKSQRCCRTFQVLWFSRRAFLQGLWRWWLWTVSLWCSSHFWKVHKGNAWPGRCS